MIIPNYQCMKDNETVDLEREKSTFIPNHTAKSAWQSASKDVYAKHCHPKSPLFYGFSSTLRDKNPIRYLPQLNNETVHVKTGTDSQRTKATNWNG